MDTSKWFLFFVIVCGFSLLRVGLRVKDVQRRFVGLVLGSFVISTGLVLLLLPLFKGAALFFLIPAYVAMWLVCRDRGKFLKPEFRDITKF